MKYLVVVEKTGTGFSAYVPDLPGWVHHSWIYKGRNRKEYSGGNYISS